MLQMGLEEKALDLAAPLASCWDSIWWRESWRALEDDSQDSSSENSTNADLASAGKHSRLATSFPQKTPG